MALVVDLRGRARSVAAPVILPPAQEVVEALRTLGGDRVVAAAGRFEVAAPADWIRDEGEAVAPYHLVLRNLHGASISLMGTPVEYDDLRLLSEEIRKRERERDLAVTQETIRLDEHHAIVRHIQLVSQHAMAIDFVEQRVAYHLMCAAPSELFATYEPLFVAVAKTLRPTPVTPAAEPPQSGVADTPGNG